MITCWPAVYRPSDGTRASWRSLRERIRSPRHYCSRHHVGRWSAATFQDDYRARGRFLTEEAIVTDVGDNGAVSRAGVEQAFVGLRGLVYATWSATPVAPRWRVALELSRPIDADEHDRVIRFVFVLEERAGITPDFASKDAPHAWSLPALHKDCAYEHFDLTGEPLDVAKALSMFPEPDPEPPPERGREQDDSYDRRIARASRYLASMGAAIAGSGGSTQTLRAAVALVRGFNLRPDDALNMLIREYNPRCQPEWSEAELKHKIRQAHQRGRMPFGAIAERGRAA